MPLSCTDCESTVCLDCIVTDHVEHRMCEISSCFDLNKVQDNLQNRQVDVHLQKEQMTDRGDEIVREVKNICQQTITKITNLTT